MGRVVNRILAKVFGIVLILAVLAALLGGAFPG